MKSFKSFITEEALDEVAAWQRKEGKSESGGLNHIAVKIQVQNFLWQLLQSQAN